MNKKDIRKVENHKLFTSKTDLRYSYPINDLKTLGDYLETAKQIMNNHRLYDTEKLTDLYILFLKLIKREGEQ